jgi:hypothetical protein
MATLQFCRNGHEKSADNTYVYTTKSGKTYGYCRDCRSTRRVVERQRMKDYLLMRRYGITRQERSAMLVAQDGLCALCYEQPATEVDHDHNSGRVRGMLCKPCNVALGRFDSPEGVTNMVQYLTEEAVA